MQSVHVDRRTFIAALSAAAAASILKSGASPAIPGIAQDPNRPEYHLLPPHNWMNDPNGPIWWKGKYHLFYQMNPHAAVWGDMNWGHAVSADMVHWRHEAIALSPTPGGPDSEGCFSGSAVVADGVPTFIYTGVQNAPAAQVTLHDGGDKLRETQLLATAEDDGLMRWKKQAAPVIAAPPAGMAVTGFRDPCPWREADAWYMAVGSGVRGQGGCALLYRSHDLHHWDYLHPLAEGKPNGRASANPVDTGEMWECPDFFALNGTHCLLYSTEGRVIWTTGDYDAHTHRYTATRQGVLDHNAFYAPKSFVAPDGRRILWGWIPEKRPEAEYAAAGWAGMMSLPRVLTATPDGQLNMTAAAEVEALRGEAERITVTQKSAYRSTLSTLRRELALRIAGDVAGVQIRLLSDEKEAWKLSLDIEHEMVRYGDGFKMPAQPAGEPLVRIFLDASTVETLIGAREAITDRVYNLKFGATEIEISVIGLGSAEVSHWPLEAISANRLTT